MKNDQITHDLTIKVGEDYAVDMVYAEDDETPVSVSGWTVEAQVRQYEQDYDYVPFTCTADATGFHLTMAKEVTRKLTYTRGTYDVFVTDPDNTARSKLVEGRVYIIPEVTR